MECEKRLSSSSEEKRNSRIEKKPASNCSILGKRKAKEEPIKYEVNEFPSKGKFLQPSMIPIVKCEKSTCESKKNISHNQKSSSRYSSTSLITSKRNEELDKKLKLLEEKENFIAEYYFRIENLITNLALQKENDKSIQRKTSEYSTAQKMTSDPTVSSKTKALDEVLSDFENNVQQISEIWLKASNDFSNTLKNLKNSSSLSPKEFEMENFRIQLAIKQAKSLTLIKTRNVITEAKKLFYNREIIRKELENLLNQESSKSKSEEGIKKSLDEINEIIVVENIEKSKLRGTGDSHEDINMINSEISEKANVAGESEKEKQILQKELIKLISKIDFLEVGKSSLDEMIKELYESEETPNSSSKAFRGMKFWMKELAQKNKTITNLNCRIFELQKACNDHSLKYNQIQVKLAEFNEKIQWNQDLWKQIKKLKEQIKGLQQNNKQLEFQKKELESKIARLDQELNRLIKINHLLNQKYLLKYPNFLGTECKKSDKECLKSGKNEDLNSLMSDKCHEEIENEIDADERIIAEKRNAINQLKTILNAMIDQENFAHKQICMFQLKIEELEKTAKA